MNQPPMTADDIAELRRKIAECEQDIADGRILRARHLAELSSTAALNIDRLLATVDARNAEIAKLLERLEAAERSSQESYSRWMVADKDWRHESAKRQELFLSRAEVTRERDNAIARVAELEQWSALHLQALLRTFQIHADGDDRWPTPRAQTEHSLLVEELVEELLRQRDCARHEEANEKEARIAHQKKEDRLHGLLSGVVAERDDASLALAMARGEGWPVGWSWKEDHKWWESPFGLYYITPVAMCRNLKRGGWKLDWHRDRDAAHDPYGSTELRRGTLHPDALAALRAYQAMVTL